MDKYYPCIRKAILSAIAFWGYFLAFLLSYGVVAVFFQSNETDLFGYPPICYILSDVLGTVISLFIFYDCFVCDYIKESEFVVRNDGVERFSFKDELKYLIKDPEFITGQAVIAFFAIVVSRVYAIPVIAFSILAELWAHRNWFATKKFFGKKKKKKGVYAFRLILHMAIWAFNLFGFVLIVGLIKMSFTPIVEVLKNYALIIAASLAILFVLCFLLLRLRAIKVQYKTIRKLKSLAKENRIKLKLPKHPYISLLRQKPEQFTLEQRHFSVNGVLVPTLLRKTPLYFLGGGIIQRKRSWYFFKIEVLTRSKFINYSFPESKRNEKKIILLSPIPREFFLASRDFSSDYKANEVDNARIVKNGPLPRVYFDLGEGNTADGDNGSEIDGALIYSGTAFCNYIRRMCDSER